MVDRPSRDAAAMGDQGREKALEGVTRVECHQGRWVVWLNVMFWQETCQADNPIENRWHRINDYASESEAQIAARYIERSVNRDPRTISGF